PFEATAIMDGRSRWTGAMTTASNTFSVWGPTRSWPKRCSPNCTMFASGAVGQLDKVRGFTTTRYAAKSWSRPRRVLARLEATKKGADVRYIVTNLTKGTGQRLYETVYCARGQAENLIKRHKSQLASDRTSCRSPLANQMRLIL